MAWLAGLAVVALVLAGWRKTARAQPRAPRSPTDAPRRVPFEVTHGIARPYHGAGVMRRVWAVVAGSGMAIVIGAVVATVVGFGLAWMVVTLTDLLKQ